MATLLSLWTARFSGANNDPAASSTVTNAPGPGQTYAKARNEAKGTFFRGNDATNKYGDGTTKSIIVELNSYSEGNNLGSQTAGTDLGLAGFGLQVSSASEDARDTIATGTEPEARATALGYVVANSESPASGAGTSDTGRARLSTQRGTDESITKVVRGRYRTSTAAALSDFQALTAEAAADETGSVVGAFSESV